MFFVSQKKYDEIEERLIAEQNENDRLREELRAEKLKGVELECKLAEYTAKEKKRSEQARRAANIKHQKDKEKKGELNG